MCTPLLFSFAGPAFALDLATRPKLAKWLDSVLATEAVKATLAEPEALCGTYKRYADTTALSKVGNTYCMDLFCLVRTFS